MPVTNVDPFGVDPSKAIELTDEELDGLVDDFYCNAREDARLRRRLRLRRLNRLLKIKSQEDSTNE